MVHQHNISFISLKGFLVLIALIFAAAASTLIITLTSAQGGTNPNAAIPLAAEVNQGTLTPGEQHWFKFTPQGANVQQFITLIFTPNQGNTANFVSVKLFEENQIQFFAQGDAGQMATFGQAEVITRDNDPQTGELFWSDFVSGPSVYYIQVLNDSDFTIDYSLFNANIGSEVIEEPALPQAPAAEVEQTAPEVPAPPDIVALNSNSPDTAQALPTEAGRVEGRLAPNSTYWYTFSYDDSNPNRLKNQKYTLFFTPDDGNRKHNVNFKLYPYSEYEIWRRGDADKLSNFGAGSIVDRDGDYNTGELLWNGTLLKGDKYLLAISNGNDIPIDYYLYHGDIINPILGPEPEPQPAPVYAAGAAPQTANPLKIGVNEGGLAPGEEAWFSFRITDFDNEYFEQMALTMIATPDDGNRIRNFTFEVFTPDGVKYWSPGDTSNLKNLGAGSVVYRDNNILTGERFWHGWVVDNELYYVQIRNGTDIHMDYHLFTGDVYRPELGEKSQPVARKAAAPGTAPYAPVELEVGINKGQLKPGQEQWYTFSRGDAAATGIVDTAFTMIFTPDDGNRIRSVNFELFEGNQLRDWAPDNRFNIIGFGKGSAVNRDGGVETGELLWKGQVLAGNIYYMRVSNESDVVIDYAIYPQDVINANLE